MWSRSRAQANFVGARRQTKRAYVEAERSFNARSKALLTNAPILRKCRSTFKKAGLWCEL